MASNYFTKGIFRGALNHFQSLNTNFIICSSSRFSLGSIFVLLRSKVSRHTEVGWLGRFFFHLASPPNPITVKTSCDSTELINSRMLIYFWSYNIQTYKFTYKCSFSLGKIYLRSTLLVSCTIYTQLNCIYRRPCSRSF